MKSELEEPLAAFSGGMKERRKLVQNSIEKLLKIKNQQTHTVNKVRIDGYHLRKRIIQLTQGEKIGKRQIRARLSANQRLSSTRPHGHGPGGAEE